jgi:hypothetical protein
MMLWLTIPQLLSAAAETFPLQASAPATSIRNPGIGSFIIYTISLLLSLFAPSFFLVFLCI